MANLTETAVWEEGIYELAVTDPVLGGPDGVDNLPHRQMANRMRYLRGRLDALTVVAAVEVTVGTGGDYATINAALEALSKSFPTHVPGGVSATVRLLAGFVMREQVIVRGVNLGWIRIVAESAEVQIGRSSLTTAVGSGNYPAFSAGDGGYLPVIDTLFTMTTSGTATGRHGVYVYGGGGVTVAPGRGVKSAGGNGAFAQTSGVISANGADFRSAGGVGAALHGGTRGALQDAILTGCTTGIEANNGASVHAGGANCSGCSDAGLRVFSGAVVNAGNANARKGASDSATDLIVSQGAIINAVGATGGTNVTPNTPSASGIIFK